MRPGRGGQEGRRAGDRSERAEGEHAAAASEPQGLHPRPTSTVLPATHASGSGDTTNTSCSDNAAYSIPSNNAAYSIPSNNAAHSTTPTSHRTESRTETRTEARTEANNNRAKTRPNRSTGEAFIPAGRADRQGDEPAALLDGPRQRLVNPRRTAHA